MLCIDRILEQSLESCWICKVSELSVTELHGHGPRDCTKGPEEVYFRSALCSKGVYTKILLSCDVVADVPACHRCLVESFGTSDNLLPPLVGLEGCCSPPPDAVAAPSSNRSGLLDGDLLCRLAPAPDFFVGDAGAGGAGDLLCLRDILNFNHLVSQH